jgi:hypothetical protein
MIDSYRKLSIEKYDEIKNIVEKDVEDIDKQVELIACLADMPIDDVYNLPINKYEDYVDKLPFLFELPKPKAILPGKLVIGDNRYSIMKQVEKMTTGQFIDLQSYLKNDMGVAYILTTIIIPEGHKYDDGYSIEDLKNEIYTKLNIEDALSIAFFLHRKLQYTINGSLRFLDWMMKKKMKKAPKEVKEQIKQTRDKLKDLEISGIGNIW